MGLTITDYEKGAPVSDVDLPAYDPAVHTVEDDPVVLLELWCACGVAHRQHDRVTHVLPQLAGFRAKHAGPGHWAVSGKEALIEREARREAGFRAVGRQDDYASRAPSPPRAAFDWTTPPDDPAGSAHVGGRAADQEATAR